MKEEEVNWLEVADQIGCLHAWHLSWAKRCEGCRQTSLSSSLKELEDRYNKEG